MQPFLTRLRERKLVQWAVAYLAGAWLLLQVLALLAEPFAWPALVMRAATVVLAIGFLAALVIAWYHGEKDAQRVSSIEVLMLAGILVIAGAAVALVAERSKEAPVPAAPASPATEQGAIAVLPFVDLSAQGDQEYFADGLTEELLNVLAQLPELRVASRTSAFSFKGSKVAIDSIARALRVANVLEGSVRKDGERLRVSAQLIDAANGYHLWSGTYDRDVGSVFAIQDEIARAIVDALQLRLGTRAGATLARQETRDPEAHARLLQAVQLFRQIARSDLEQGIALAREAVARDSSYARAWALLARLYHKMAYHGHGDRDKLVAQSRAAALRAQTLDPELPEAAHALGILERDYDWDFRAAEAHFSRAIELNPSMAAAYSSRGWLRAQLGRTREAVGDALRAVQLDPLNPALYSNLGSIYSFDGELERSIEAYHTSIEFAENPLGYGNMALSYAELGRDAEAMAAAQRAVTLLPEHEFTRAVLAYVHAKAGRRTEAERYIRMLETQEIPNHYMAASAWLALGERERALDLLEKSYEAREANVADLGADPAFAAVRNEPRVQALLERMNLR